MDITESNSHPITYKCIDHIIKEYKNLYKFINLYNGNEHIKKSIASYLFVPNTRNEILYFASINNTIKDGELTSILFSCWSILNKKEKQICVKYASMIGDLYVLKKARSRNYKFNNNILLCACSYDQKEVIKYLMICGLKINNYEHVIELSIKHNKLNVIKNLVYAGADLAKNAYTHIMNSSEYGMIDILKYIISNKHIMEYEHMINRYPLGGAMKISAKNGRLDITKLLVGHGAKIGWDTLELARDNGHEDIVQYLLSMMVR